MNARSQRGGLPESGELKVLAEKAKISVEELINQIMEFVRDEEIIASHITYDLPRKGTNYDIVLKDFLGEICLLTKNTLFSYEVKKEEKIINIHPLNEFRSISFNKGEKILGIQLYGTLMSFVIFSKPEKEESLIKFMHKIKTRMDEAKRSRQNASN